MKLELTQDEALVHFEWLARVDEVSVFPCEHEAERQVLWAMHSQLKKSLSEPFRPDYVFLVKNARSRIVGRTNS